MKPELFAGILLFVIILAAIMNLCFLASLVKDITELSQIAAHEAFMGNWAEAESAAESALNLWSDHEGYTRTVLRQSECDRAADVLWRLLAAVCNKETDTVEGTAEQAVEIFRHLLEMERPQFSSIF